MKHENDSVVYNSDKNHIRELSCSEVQEISGGFLGPFLVGVAIVGLFYLGYKCSGVPGS